MLEGLRLEDLFLLTVPTPAPQDGPKPTDDAAATSDAKDRDPEWLAFEADVRGARMRLKRAAMARMDEGKEPARITVRAVVLEAGRSRSQLYASHAHLLPLIAAAQAAVERLAERRAERARIVAAKPSRSALEGANRKLTAEVKRLEAVDTSKLATELYARMFPRDRERDQAEIAQLRAAIARKDAEIQAFSGHVTALSAIKSLGHLPGRVIDVQPEPGPTALNLAPAAHSRRVRPRSGRRGRSNPLAPAP